MNCVKGDLARVISDAETELAGVADLFVKCLSPMFQPSGALGWALDPIKLKSGLVFNGCADHLLRPIRDPGDDAQDESLSWKKVPITDKREELA